MKANELKIGMEFKLPGQRKWRKVFKKFILTEHDHIPPVGRKVLIILEGCRQLALLEETEVVFKDIFAPANKSVPHSDD